MTDEWYDNPFIIFPIILLLALMLVGGFGLFANWLNSKSCAITAKDMGFKHKFSFQTGCMIEVNGSLVPINSYRVF